MLAPPDPNPPAFRVGRRWFLTAAAALALPLPRGASALATDTFSLMLGDTEAIFLSDGYLTLPAGIFAASAPKEEFEALMTSIYGKVPETVTPAVNIALLKSGGETILIDTGSGTGFQPTAGKLHENLALNEIDPATITKVVFTHGHPDHVWGTLLDGGALAFPNAAYYVGGTEWDFWMDPDIQSKLPEPMHPFVKGAKDNFAAVKDRVTMLGDGDTVAPGISVIDTPGHTPGHVSVFIEGGGGLILAADTLPNEIISVGHPDWAFGFDLDPDGAIATRTKLLDRVVADGLRLHGYHFTYPGIGRVEKADTGFRFLAEGA